MDEVPGQTPGAPPDEAALKHAFDAVKARADAALAQGNAGLAAHIYLEVIEKLPAGHALVAEAKYHRAQLLEAANFHDVAIPLYVELARDRHDGAWKALDRLLEAGWSAAREAPPGPAGRPAREALRKLVDKLGHPTPQREPALAWLATADAEEQINEADQAYHAGDFARAAQLFEQAGDRARARGLTGLARKALNQAAAVYWHNQRDLPGTLRVLAALGPAFAESPALKAIHEKVSAALVDDLRGLVRRGDRREAFARLAAAYPLLPAGQPQTEHLLDLYIRELASHHIAGVDDRLIAITRQSTQAEQELASPEGSHTRGTDPADAVAANLKLGALREQHDRLAALRHKMYASEIAVLKAADPKMYADLQESSRESGALGVLIDRVHRLALERMHYRVKVKSETKDALASLLPAFLANKLVDDTFQLIRQLEFEVEELTQQFLERAYPKR